MTENLKTNNNRESLFMRPFVSTVAHAIFFDVTHDNDSPITKRSPFDPLASSALVSMTYSAIGSNRGLDELVPHHIHVVHEERQYNVWDENGKNGVNFQIGIINAKKVMNALHQFLGIHGYLQAYVDQRDRDTVVVTRHNPNNHKSVILVARTAFYPLDQGYAQSFEPLRIEGKFEKILFEMKMTGQIEHDFVRDDKVINGYNGFQSQVCSIVDSDKSELIDLEIKASAGANLIKFKHFPPSSVLVFSVSLLDMQAKSLEAIKVATKQYDESTSEIVQVINQLDIIDLNYILFRSNIEEKDDSGHGVYVLSNGPFVYCGLAGVMFHLAKIRTHNDLSK